ncbi:MAG: cysteine synthase A [Gammaproteobacteria bacterium]|nr:cysteine synthase A [Gammaproteobacteria bacterium]
MNNLATAAEFQLKDQTNHSSSLCEVVNFRHSTLLHKNILSTVGNTPIVKINTLANPSVNLYAKIESFNPLGSVKDRLALGIIEAAERDGSLTPGQTVIEATSGNTGIGLAMVCAQKGYPLVIVMAENFSVERRRLMRYLGAKVVLTPASKMGRGMVAKAKELAKEHNWFFCDQFANNANADIHSATTAKEILSAFPNNSLDYFVTGLGTGGTLLGIGRELQKHTPNTRIIATEPDNSPVLKSGIEQKHNAAGEPIGSHPAFRPHPVQGWSPDFISKISSDAIKSNIIDEIVPISGDSALHFAQALAKKEGIFCGISSGATLAAAVKVAENAPKGSNILCMLPDTGERYLSTPLFENISIEMTEDEIAVSKSTPGYRFDAQKEKPGSNVPSKKASDRAATFLQNTIQSKEDPVVMFGLEWCEFCWSIRKLFNRAGIAFRSIDLDSTEYQEGEFGADIRCALQQQTGKTTIPQLFVGGDHIGGCTETFEGYKTGKLQKLLTQKNIAFRSDVDIDLASLLPNWIHSR